LFIQQSQKARRYRGCIPKSSHVPEKEFEVARLA
jgi:hypothetical protein